MPLYLCWNTSSNTCCFQILIARGAYLAAENANGYVYDSLTVHLLFDALQFFCAFPLKGLFIYLYLILYLKAAYSELNQQFDGAGASRHHGCKSLFCFFFYGQVD